MPRAAPPVSVVEGGGAALGPLRRGRVPRDGGGDPRGARRRALPPRADGAPAPRRRRGRMGLPSLTGGSAGRLRARAVAGERREPRARDPLRGGGSLGEP